MKKQIFLALIIINSLFSFSLEGITKADLDRVIDFDTSLRNLDLSPDNPNKFVPGDRDRFILLEGTLGAVNPSGNSVARVNEDDLIDSDVFIKTFRQKDSMGIALRSFLTSKTLKMLNGEIPEDKLVSRIAKDFFYNSRKKSFYSQNLFKNILLSPFLKELTKRTLKGDELAFFNRLLLEAVFPKTIKTISLDMTLVKGEWIGYDDVRQYNARVRITGEDCFRIFVRDSYSTVEDLHIPLNSRILTTAKPKEIIKTEDDLKLWLLEGFYVRAMK